MVSCKDDGSGNVEGGVVTLIVVIDVDNDDYGDGDLFLRTLNLVLLLILRAFACVGDECVCVY